MFLAIAGIGYVIGFTGFFTGTLFALGARKLGRLLNGTLMGFTAGLLIAFVSFEMLPVALEGHGLYVGVGGILLGTVVSVLAESKIDSFKKGKNRLIKTSLMIGMGVMLHTFSEGMAVGSLLHTNFLAGVYMAIGITIHCFPEGIAVVLPLREGGISKLKIIAVPFVLAIPMALGSLTGALLTNISSIFVSLCLAFAGGVIIYITCGEILPETREQGKLAAIGSALGFALGTFLTSSI